MHTASKLTDIFANKADRPLTHTEGKIKVCTWLREISSCSCLTVLLGPAWVLLSKTNKPLFSPLYNWKLCFKVEIKADMMIPYHHTKAWGQVPCEDVAMRIPLPEAWVYLFRAEKAHISVNSLLQGNLNIGSRLGAVKSAHRRAGKVRTQLKQD